jgi:hypothetical protein
MNSPAGTVPSPKVELLLLMADAGAYPGVWVGGLKLWHSTPGPPISSSLKEALNEWVDVYTHLYFENGDEWISESSCSAWHRQGWRLFVRLNRELHPHGYLIVPAFETDEPPRARQQLDRFDRATGPVVAEPGEAEEIWTMVEHAEAPDAGGECPHS